MKQEKETKKKLLESAKKEFIEKGYLQASLRNICKNAGVTTGALYFFFEDKEDLFAALVEEPLQNMKAIMKEHYEEEAGIPAETLREYEDFSEDKKAAEKALRYMYHYREEFELILTKSQGSRFECAVDEFVSISEKHYRRMADMMTEALGQERMDDYLLHWLSHQQIDTFTHMLIHEPSEEAAIKHMERIVEYLVHGWLGLFKNR